MGGRDSGEWESSKRAESQAVYLMSYLSGQRYDHKKRSTWVEGKLLMLIQMGKDLEIKWLGNQWQGSVVRTYLVGTLEQTQNMRIFVTHTYAHQNVPTTVGLSVISWLRWSVLWTSKLLSLAMIVFAWWDQEWSAYNGMEGDFACYKKRFFFLSLRLIWLFVLQSA